MLTWEEVASKPEFRNLPAADQDAARKQYFREVVQPRVPADMVATAWEQFDQDSRIAKRDMPAGVAPSEGRSARPGGQRDPRRIDPPESRNPFAVANDTVIEAANAIAGGLSSAANFVSPGNRVSGFIEERIIKPGEANQSDLVQAEKARFRQEVADADTIGGEVGATLGYVARNPLQAAAQAAGSFVLPAAAVRGAGGLASLAGAGARGTARAGLAGGALAGGAMAGGDAAGTAYELVKRAGGTEEQAREAARKASMIPAAVGAAGGVVGAERLLAGAKGFGGSAASRAAKTAAVEGAQEAAEEGITQYEGQRAAVPFDPSIDPTKGVASAATMGVVLGAATGAGTSLLAGSPWQRPQVAALKIDPPLAADPPEQQRAKMMAAFDRSAAVVGMSPKALAAVRERSAMVPLDQLGAFLARSADALAKRGLGGRMPPELLEALAAGPLADQAPQAVNNIVGTLQQAGALPQDAIPAAGLVDDGQDFTGLDAAPAAAPMAQDAIPAPEVAEAIPTGDAVELEPVPVGEATEMLPTPEATELEAIPAGEATELDPEVIQADDIMAADGEPFTSRTSAAAKAYSTGGGEVVRIPNHFGSGKPGFVVRPIVEARPAGTRGTTAADIAPQARPAAAPDMAANTNRGATDEQRQGQEGRRQEVLTAPATQPAQGGADEVAAPENMDRPMAAGQPVATDKPRKTKVYKNRGVADAARKAAGNTMKLQKVKNGYILRPKTDAEIEAEGKNARRLTARKSIDVQRDPLLVAIAKNGGLAPTEKADTIGEGNKLTRGGHVFRGNGLPIDTMAEYLAEDRYIPPQEMERDGGTTWLRDAIQAEHMGTRQHFSQRGEGWLEDRMAEMERQAQMEAEDDPFGPLSDLTPEDLESSGYTQVSPEVQALTEQLMADAEAAGIDTEAIRERVAMQTDGATADEYEAALQAAVRQALGQDRRGAEEGDARAEGAGNQDRGEVDGGQEQGAGQGLTLSDGAASVLAREDLLSPVTFRQQKSPYAEFATGTYIVTVQQFDGGPGAVVYAVFSRRSGNELATWSREVPAGLIESRDFAPIGDAARRLFERVRPTGIPELLAAQTPEDLRAKAEREEAAAEAERRKRTAEQERLRKEAEDRDARARADQTVDSFELGQSADQQMSGMRDMFADAPQIDTTAERVETAPAAAQTEQPASRSASTDAQAAQDQPQDQPGTTGEGAGASRPVPAAQQQDRRRAAAEAVRQAKVLKTNANSAMVWQIIGPDGEAMDGPPGVYPGREGPLAGSSTMGQRGWKTKREADAALAALKAVADRILLPATAQEPAPEYSPPYETDLFGNPVPTPTGANRRAARRPAAGAGDVDTAGSVQGAAPEAPAGRYASRTALVTTRQQKLGATRIRTIADAANALAYLRTSAVERLDAIVTDEAGKPLAVIGGFKGALSQTSVYPSTLVGEAILTPGARRIWLVHNHPSGKPNLSRADEMLAQQVARTFDGTAIDVGGIVAVAREGWRGGIKGDAFADLQGGDLAPVDGPSVPAQERQIVEDGRLAPGISSPSDAKQTVRRLVEANMGRPTIVLMDSQNQPVAAIPWAAEDAKPLRNNGKLDALFRAVATANAGSAIIGTGGPLTSSAPGMTMDQAKNLAAGLEAVDVRVLDIIDRDGKSAAEQGLPLKASAMFSRAPAADPAKFPPIASLDGVSVGPMFVRPRPIAAGRPLYRETDIGGLDDLLRTEGEPGFLSVFVTDNRDLAIGQGDNRGVMVTFRPDSLSGAEHRKPGTGDTTGREYRTDLVAPRAVQSVTMPKAELKRLRGLTKLRLRDFDQVENADGTVTFNRKGLAAPDALFSRATGAGLPLADAQASVAAIREALPSAPPIDVHATLEDAPAELQAIIRRAGAANDVEGVYWQGRIHVFPQHIASRERLEFVVGHHEVRHHGLAALLGDERVPLMRRLYATNKAVREAADAYLKANPFADRATAVEEALADMPVERVQSLRGWQRIVAAIRDGLRRFADTIRDRMPGLAAAIEPAEWTDADITALVRRAEDVSRAPVQQQVPQAEEAAMFSSRSQRDANRERIGWNVPESSKFDDFVFKFQDKNIDLRRAIAAITAERESLEDRWDAYLQEELFHGRAAKRTQDFVNKELQPLLRDMTLRKVTMERLDLFLHARHAEEANKLIAERNKREDGGQLDLDGNVIVSPLQDGGSGMLTADARALLNGEPVTIEGEQVEGFSPEERSRLEAIAKRVDGIIATTRNTYVGYGLESKATVDGWASMFKHYVPLMREDHDGGMGIGQGFSIKGREAKSRTGSTAKVVDILANIAMQRERAIVRGEKNRVAVALAGLAKLNPQPDLWTFDTVPTERVYDDASGTVVERQVLGFKSKPNVLVAKIPDSKGNIQERAIIFNERNPRAVRMAASLKNLDAAQLEGLIGAVAKVTRYFASINTQYNPIFGIVNLARDLSGSAINLTSTPLAGKRAAVLSKVPAAWAGIYRDIRKNRKGSETDTEWARLWEDFQKEGGQTAFRDMFRTSEDRANAIRDAMDPTRWMDSPWGKVVTAGGALKLPIKYVAQPAATVVFNWLEDYNLTMENAVRLAAYKVALEQGMPKQRAASLAKNLTVNFNRRGQVGTQVGALYAFFNASVQGTARMGQVLFDTKNGDGLRLTTAGRTIIGGGIMLGAIQAALLAAAGFDDDEPPQFVRERSLIIPLSPVTGDKKYITIPMPLGWHVFPNIGRAATEFALGGFQDPGKRAIELMAVFADAFNPIGNAGVSLQTLTPTVADPAIAILENRDWTGKPIAKESLDPVVPGHQLARDVASIPARVISEGINYITGGTEFTRGAISPTPDQIDYLWGQLTGGVGRELTKVMQTGQATYTGEDLPPHKMPLVGRFYGDAEGPSSQASRFYEAVNRIRAHKAELEGLRTKQDGPERITAYLRENPEAGLTFAADNASKIVRDLRNRKRKFMEAGASRADIKAIEDQITETMRSFNERMLKPAKKPAKQPAMAE